MQYYLISKYFILLQEDNETKKFEIKKSFFKQRFIGDDVKYLGRGGETSPPFKGIGLKDGEVMRKDWFPIVWTS